MTISLKTSYKTHEDLCVWLQENGQPVSCLEKIRVLEENWREVQQIVKDAFDDAVLMGVSAQGMREKLVQYILTLKTPKVDE